MTLTVLGLWKKDYGKNALLVTSCWGCRCSAGLTAADVGLDHLAKVVSVRRLHRRGLRPPSTLCHPCGTGGWGPPPLGAGIYMKLLGILCTEALCVLLLALWFSHSLEPLQTHGSLFYALRCDPSPRV